MHIVRIEVFEEWTIRRGPRPSISRMSIYSSMLAHIGSFGLINAVRRNIEWTPRGAGFNNGQKATDRSFDLI